MLAAFRRCDYRAPGMTLRIGQRSRPLDSLLAGLGLREATMITAHNPSNHRMPASWNDRAFERLRGALQSWTLLPAESGEGRWREAQFLVGAPAARLKPLGRRFRQLALVRLRRHARPALVSLR